MGKSGTLNVEIGGSEEQAKFGFPVATVTVYKANSKNHILLNSDWNCLILVFKLKPYMSIFGKINLTHKFKILCEISMKW